MSGRNVCSVVPDATEKSGYGWADGQDHRARRVEGGSRLGFQSCDSTASTRVAQQGVQGHTNRTIDRAVAGLMWYPSPSINGSSPGGRGKARR